MGKIKTYINENEWIKPFIGAFLFFIFCIIFSPQSNDGTPTFLKIDNLTNVLRQVSEKGIIAIGLTFVIIAGGIDLSVGAILGLTATFTAFGLMDWQLGLATTIILTLLIGAAAGFVNGFITSYGKMQSFISTLAMMVAARGLALLISGSTSRNIGFGENAAPESFKIFTSEILGVPFPVYIFISVTIIFFIVLQNTRFGRYVYAIGSNLTAAELAGLKVNRIRILTFIISGVLSALAGIIHAAQLQQGNPNDGVGFELDAIAAVVIGGTSLMGGRGTIQGTFAGVIIIGLLNNIIGLNGIDKDMTLIIQGIIIVVAVFIQQTNFNILKQFSLSKRLKYTLGIVFVFILILLAFFILKSRKEHKVFVIGFSQCNSSEPWREAMNKEILNAAAQYKDIKVIISDANQDNSKQVADVENFIVRGVDLLIISPNEAQPLTAIVEKAYDSGIPVIVLDRKIMSDKYTVFIGADNYLIGQEAGKYAVRLLNGKGNIVEIWGLKGSTPAQERHDGFIKGLELEKNPGIKIIYEQDGSWLREKGFKIMEDALQRFENIDLVYAHNDPMAVGAYLAARTAKRHNNIFFLGIDGLPGKEGGCQAVLDNQLTATFLYPTGGKEAIECAIKIKNGEKVPKKITLPTTVIDKNNAEKFANP